MKPVNIRNPKVLLFLTLCLCNEWFGITLNFKSILKRRFRFICTNILHVKIARLNEPKSTAKQVASGIIRLSLYFPRTRLSAYTYKYDIHQNKTTIKHTSKSLKRKNWCDFSPRRESFSNTPPRTRYRPSFSNFTSAHKNSLLHKKKHCSHAEIPFWRFLSKLHDEVKQLPLRNFFSIDRICLTALSVSGIFTDDPAGVSCIDSSSIFTDPVDEVASESCTAH